MPVTATVWVTALVFGLVMGSIIGLRPADRPVIRTITRLVITAGGLLWLTDPQPMTDPAIVAVSLALGGLTTLVGLGIAARLKPA